MAQEDVNTDRPRQGVSEDFLRDQVLDEYKHSRQVHEQEFCQGAYLDYSHWMNHILADIDPDDYRSNIAVPAMFPIIETAHAHLMAPWTQTRELISCTAIEEAGVEKAPVVAGYINNKIRRDVPRAFSKNSLVMKSGLVFGRGVTKVWPRAYPSRNVLQRTAIKVGNWLTPGGFRVGSNLGWKNVPPHRQIEYGYVDPFDWWFTPGCRFLDDADWTFELYYLTHSQVQEKIESGEWAKVDIQEGDALGYDEYRQKRIDMDERYTDHIHARQPRRLHRVIEAQGRFKVRDSKGSTPKYDNVIAIIVDEKWLVTPTETSRLATWNGKPSYNCWEPTMDPGGLEPISMIQHCRDVLNAINDFQNIGMDNARKVLESTLLVDHTKLRDDRFFLGPGEINWVRDPAYAVKALEMKDLPPSFYQQMGFLFDLLQKSTGISDYFGGMNTADTDRLTKTAKGMQLMANLAASRLQPLLASMDAEHYQPIAQAIHETAKQRMMDKVSVPMPGNPNSPFALVGPDEMDVQLNYAFNTKALDPSVQMRRQEFLELVGFLQSLEQPLMMQGYQLDLYEVARMTMDLFDRGADVARVMKKLPQQIQAGEGVLPAGSPEAGLSQPGMPGRPAPPPVEAAA